ncbi:polyhydroxybutyrate depolymerase [Mycolicibacterium moriokaense]|nr:polyhydroxybutyrate depolymerase [Mycolicibacterium moriokaense]
MATRLLAAVLAVLVAAGCSAPGSAAPQGFTFGPTSHSLRAGGLDRSYLLYIPDELPASAPLVVMLHGGFGSAQQAERAYGWDQLADTAKFVVAYPDGEGHAWNTNGGCCGRPGRENIDDVGFVTAVVADISANIGVDANRVYATGISNGGMMAYALACNTGTFAAIGPDSATQLDGCAAPHPTSVMHIHGTDDRLIRYDGEPGAGVARIDGPAVADLNAFWRRVDRCAAPTSTTGGAITTSTADCADGRGVVLTTVAGGGHEWPGFATSSLWQFFAAHPRPGA